MFHGQGCNDRKSLSVLIARTAPIALSAPVAPIALIALAPIELAAPTALAVPIVPLALVRPGCNDRLSPTRADRTNSADRAICPDRRLATARACRLRSGLH